MIFLISPAKTLDFDTASLSDDFTQAAFLSESEKLIRLMRNFEWHDLGRLMKVSEKIAKLNVQRFLDWQQPFTMQNSKQAVYAFKGDVYTGLSVESMSIEQVNYLQSNLRILSGLYGLLKPLDLMQAYRLEMGTKLDNPKGKTLYEFWGQKITEQVNKTLNTSSLTKEHEPVLVNLASNEYFKSVQGKLIDAKIITPIFKDEKNGVFKIISFYAKKARGLMVRYAAVNLIENAEELKGFNYEGYSFCEAESTATEWLFLRNEMK